MILALGSVSTAQNWQIKAKFTNFGENLSVLTIMDKFQTYFAI